MGIGPSGAITFISELYEGSISDKEIVKRSGILKKSFCDDNDSIMDEGDFTIQNELATLNVEYNIPSFLGCRAPLPEAEVKESETTVSVRIQVEILAITRIKQSKAMNHIPLTLHGFVNHIKIVSCILCSFLHCLLKNLAN